MLSSAPAWRTKKRTNLPNVRIFISITDHLTGYKVFQLRSSRPAVSILVATAVLCEMSGKMEAARSNMAPADGTTATEHDTSCAIAAIRRWFDARSPRSVGQKSRLAKISQATPTTSPDRRAASLVDQPIPMNQLGRRASETEQSSQETVLYLGYGSNMSAETFRGRRNIQPISQINALVPQLALTFDLPGVPYTEPCFANTRYRHPAESGEKNALHPPYHKDEWSKGLVGIVYEITKADFAHVIATEGGGASYQDVLVDCYALEQDAKEKVPMEPRGATFKAHTLFSPPTNPRPDPSYAQPSPRYLKLLTNGAEEHSLPYEYQEYLKSIGTYTPTTTKQRLGQFIFLALWGPIFAFIFGGASLFLDKDGRYPKWYANFAMATFAACWGSYDDIFKKIFGDGERTIEKGSQNLSGLDEKEGLIRYHTKDYGAVVSSNCP
jgi:hypothetical protein